MRRDIDREIQNIVALRTSMGHDIITPTAIINPNPCKSSQDLQAEERIKKLRFLGANSYHAGATVEEKNAFFARNKIPIVQEEINYQQFSSPVIINNYGSGVVNFFQGNHNQQQTVISSEQSKLINDRLLGH
jgi:hypothetical protein